LEKELTNPDIWRPLDTKKVLDHNRKWEFKIPVKHSWEFGPGPVFPRKKSKLG